MNRILPMFALLAVAGCSPYRHEVDARLGARAAGKAMTSDRAVDLAEGQWLLFRVTIPDEYPSTGMERIAIAPKNEVTIVDETARAKDRTTFRLPASPAPEGLFVRVFATDDPSTSVALAPLPGKTTRHGHHRMTKVYEEADIRAGEGGISFVPGVHWHLLRAPGARQDPSLDALVRMIGPASLPRLGALPRRTVCVPAGTFSA